MRLISAESTRSAVAARVTSARGTRRHRTQLTRQLVDELSGLVGRRPRLVTLGRQRRQRVALLGDRLGELVDPLLALPELGVEGLAFGVRLACLGERLVALAYGVFQAALDLR